MKTKINLSKAMLKGLEWFIKQEFGNVHSIEFYNQYDVNFYFIIEYIDCKSKTMKELVIKVNRETKQVSYLKHII